MRDEHVPLAAAALALVLLPFALDLVGLPLRSAVDVVVFAIACMGLNVLLGHSGLVSFGHGAWFGLAAYAAALSQRYWFPGAIVLPFLFAIVFVAAGALLSGALILRRRGVYFSLLTLALTALLFAIAYRWTELTGGESGLGGVTRASFLGPALGALFFILFREFLSIWTPHWLFYFGLLFVGFIVFSPTGLVGVAGRVLAPFRKRIIEAAAMAGRQIAADAKLPQIYRRDAASEAPVLLARGLIKRFGGIHAVDGIDLAVKDRTLHALIGPNGAGKTTAFNLLSGLFPPDAGRIELAGRSIAGLKPEDITTAGVGRSFQITNLFGGLSAQQNLRLAVQARSTKRFALWTSAAAMADVNDETAELIAFLGLAGMERAEAASLSYGGQ